MSLGGRYVIDRVKRAVGRYLKLPVPPYEDPNFWEKVYKDMGPDDVFEWGQFGAKDLFRYKYRNLYYDFVTREQKAGDVTIETTLGETLGVHNNEADEKPILILGCGNSEFGEHLLEHGWRGPIVQVDVASRVVDSLSIRCSDYLSNGDMMIAQDDASQLSTIQDDTMNAVFDKGLIDALFCADDYRCCSEIFVTTYRVLKPRGHFLWMSQSRPEFMFPKLIPTPLPFSKLFSIQIRLLDNVYFYRFTKVAPPKAVTSLRHKRRR
jgi:ubiquinone/menaquinone biosynthesis C-methylase UbiE